MAGQPERPIERLLRDCGKQRVPPERLELHPANRRALQDEVARVYAPTKRTFNWSFISWVPRLAWAGSGVLIVAISAWLIMSSANRVDRQNTLVNNESVAKKTSPVAAPAPSPPPETAPSKESTPLLANNQPPPVADSALNLSDSPAGKADAPAAASLALAESRVSKDFVQNRETVASPSAATPPQLALMSGNVTAHYNSVSDAPAALTDSFRQALAQNFVAEEKAKQLKATANPQSPAVLASFQMERIGSQLRIIDRDGSIYTGSFTNIPLTAQSGRPVTAQPVSGLGATLARRTKDTSGSNSQAFFFQVTGTNRTLQQPVVFNGRWSGPVGSLPVATESEEASRGLLPQTSSGAGVSSGTASRIYGRATVGEGKEIVIQAISAQP